MAGWSNKPSRFIKSVEGDLTKKRNQIAGDMLQGVIMQSPVDTGAFRANHRVSIDADDLEYDSASLDPSGNKTLREGLTVIASNDKPYSEVVIQNNLPYAEALENGHSEQAPGPSGVYGVTFDAVVEKHR